MMKISDGFLRGLEKPIILWLLFHKPRHGYEIIVEFKKLTGRKLKPSIVYPFLHRLEVEGFASGQWTFKGKRKIRHYYLTERGEELLQKVREMFTKPIKEMFLDFIDKERELHKP
jgi:DNA-binding PadR family transcriptional regulator